jgi:hypothetical protein
MNPTTEGVRVLRNEPYERDGESVLRNEPSERGARGLRNEFSYERADVKRGGVETKPDSSRIRRGVVSY